MFRVQWKRQASDQLAEIWLLAIDQNAIANASHEIDLALAQDPENQGESRPNRHRVMYVSPLGVRFKVYPERQLVRVLACWQIQQV